MTNREFYTYILISDVDETLKDYAREMIAKLDERNAKRSEKPSKTQLANEPFKVKLVELFGKDDVYTATYCAESLCISVQKASALLRQLVEEGKLMKCEIKVPKKGKQIGYYLPTETVDEVEEVGEVE